MHASITVYSDGGGDRSAFIMILGILILSSSRLSSFSDMGSGMTVGAKNGESFD